MKNIRTRFAPSPTGYMHIERLEQLYMLTGRKKILMVSLC